MTVSVALCSRNGVGFIEAQLASILNQSSPIDEIVVSDDGSTDGTPDLVEHILEGAQARDGLRYTVLRNATPLGVTANFEQALSACGGEVIFLADQDDIWHPDKVAALLELLDPDEGAPLLVASNARMIDAEGGPLGLSLFDALGVSSVELDQIAEDGFAALMRRNVVTGTTVALRRSLLEAAMPFPRSWVHDEWLAVIASAIGRIEFSQSRLVDYRQHGGNEIGASRVTWRRRLQRLTAPRTERNRRLLARAADLAERLPGIGASQERQRAAMEKLQHERVRSALPANRLARILPIAKEWGSGRYRSCGLGAQDILRDLVQPV